MNPEIVEILPPTHLNPSIFIHNENVVNNIMDVDKDGDSSGIVLSDEKVNYRYKGKGKEIVSDGCSNKKAKESFVNSSYGFGMAINGPTHSVESESSFPVPPDLIDLDGHSSDCSDDYGYNDQIYDDLMDGDEYSILQSHFDRVDIPPGIEAPIPFVLPDHTQKEKHPNIGSSSSLSSWLPHFTQLESCPLSNLNLKPQSAVSNPGVVKPKNSLPGQSKQNSIACQFQEKTTSQSGSPLNTSLDEPFNSLWSLDPFKRKRTPVKAKCSTNSMSSSLLNGMMPHLGVEPLVSGHHVGAMNVANPAHIGTLDCFPAIVPVSQWVESLKYKKRSFINPGIPQGFHELSTPFHDSKEEIIDIHWVQKTTRDLKHTEFGDVSTNPFDAGSTQDLEENLRKLDNFKRFDIVEDHSDHYFSNKQSSSQQPLTKWVKRVQEDWGSLQKDLPDTIFVRVYETRMDLLRAAIMGAEGTPYHDGLFFFDVFFPNFYPSVPPLVHYHSGGLRVNPNLYSCGKVCLSLLNTWSGEKNEMWIPGVSTMLQVLVSIQGLILNAKPFFNEPGYAHWSGSGPGEVKSQEYNEDTFILSLKTMVYTMQRPPKHFEDLVVGHFCKRSHDILVACRAYLDGAQVGCLVKGGIQDVDAGDKSSSKHFKASLAGFVPKLAKDFVGMGAKDCEKFLSSTASVNKSFFPEPGLSFPIK